MQQSPQSNNEWTIHSTNEPVVHAGEESEVDIWARLTTEDTRISLLIECKKNDPKFIDWVFFSNSNSFTNLFTIFQIINEPNESGWTTMPRLHTVNLTGFDSADDAREVKGHYYDLNKKEDNEKTKTSNTAVRDATRQITIGSQAIETREEHLAGRLGAATPALEMEWKSEVLIPIIVTSAKLKLLDFNADKVDAGTGEIPFSAATLKEVPYLVFEYPIPSRLQHRPKNDIDIIGKEQWFTRKDIIVVTSTSFNKLLENMSQLF